MSIFKPVNYFREAFVHPLNLGVMLVAALTAFFLSEWGLASHVILSFMFGIELTYLGIVPHLSRFRQSVRQRIARERGGKAGKKTIFERLDKNGRRRFLVLKHLTKLIQENFDRLPYSSQGLLENIRKKVNDLLTNYLQLLELNYRYKEYIKKTDKEQLVSDIEEEEKNVEEAESEKLQNSRKRRLNILQKRLKKLETARENNMVCESHLETIEDAIRYIYEQSMTMSDPEEIGFQLDNLLSEVEETSEIVDELDDELVPMNQDIDSLDIDHDFDDTDKSWQREKQQETEFPQKDSDNRLKES